MSFKIEILSKSEIEKGVKESQSNKPKEEKKYKPYIFEDTMKKQEVGKGFKITIDDWIDEINSHRKMNGYEGTDYSNEKGKFKGPSIFMMKKSKEKILDEEGNPVMVNYSDGGQYQKQFNTIKIENWYNKKGEWLGWYIIRVYDEYIPPKKEEVEEGEESKKKTKKKK